MAANSVAVMCCDAVAVLHGSGRGKSAPTSLWWYCDVPAVPVLLHFCRREGGWRWVGGARHTAIVRKKRGAVLLFFPEEQQSKERNTERSRGEEERGGEQGFSGACWSSGHGGAASSSGALAERERRGRKKGGGSLLSGGALAGAREQGGQAGTFCSGGGRNRGRWCAGGCGVEVEREEQGGRQRGAAWRAPARFFALLRWWCSAGREQPGEKDCRHGLLPAGWASREMREVGEEREEEDEQGGDILLPGGWREGEGERRRSS